MAKKKVKTTKEEKSKLSPMKRDYLSGNKSKKKRTKNQLINHNKNTNRDIQKIAKVALLDLRDIFKSINEKQLKTLFKENRIEDLQIIIRRISCLMDDDAREKLKLALEDGYIYNSKEEMKTMLLPMPQPRTENSTLLGDRDEIDRKMRPRKGGNNDLSDFI